MSENLGDLEKDIDERCRRFCCLPAILTGYNPQFSKITCLSFGFLILGIGIHLALWISLGLKQSEVVGGFRASYTDNAVFLQWERSHPLHNLCENKDYPPPPPSLPLLDHCVERMDSDDPSPWALPSQSSSYRIYVDDEKYWTPRQAAVHWISTAWVTAVWTCFGWAVFVIIVALASWFFIESDEQQVLRLPIYIVVRTVLTASINTIIICLLLLLMDLSVNPGYDKLEIGTGNAITIHRHAYVSNTGGDSSIVIPVMWSLVLAVALQSLLRYHMEEAEPWEDREREEEKGEDGTEKATQEATKEDQTKQPSYNPAFNPGGYGEFRQVPTGAHRWRRSEAAPFLERSGERSGQRRSMGLGPAFLFK